MPLIRPLTQYYHASVSGQLVAVRDASTDGRDSPGNQHRSAPPDSTTANPFDPSLRRISQYTAQEIATLSSRLEKQLGPEYISSRPGAAGQKVHYVAAEKCINLANEVFGFNGWSSGIQNVQIDFVSWFRWSSRECGRMLRV